jgi:PPM family protein phosphatase
MRTVVGARTDAGRVRPGNEDSYLISAPLFVVADGIGGQVAGEVASSTAVDVIADQAPNARAGEPDSLAQIVQGANSAIWKRAQGDATLRGMGTTCTLAMIDDATAQLAHVGDSRAYLFRNGELSQLTEDHTLVWRMVQEGRLSAREANHHPQRNVITRALGVDSDVKVDLLTVTLVEGDRLLLCSDGLTSMVDDPRIRDVLGSEDDPQVAADRLVDLANEAGGEDNITALVLEIRAGDEPAGGEREAGERASAAGVTEPREDETRSPPRGRRLAVILIVVAAIVGGGFLGGRYVLNNSWYVGLNDEDLVTVYRGIPDEIGGLSLSEVEEETTLALSDLPDNYHDNLQEGIKADSLADARDTVANLQQRASTFRQENSDEPNRTTKKRSQ